MSARNTIRNSALTVRASSQGLRTNKQVQKHILDKFLEDVGDDFCRVGNLAPWLIESAGVMCNIPGIPN